MGHDFDQDQLAAMIIGNCEKDADYASLVFNSFKTNEFPLRSKGCLQSLQRLLP